MGKHKRRRRSSAFRPGEVGFLVRKILLFSLWLALGLVVVCTALAVPASSPVVSDPKDQVNAAISGSSVIWQDYRNKAFGCSTAQNCIGADIYLKDLGTGIEQHLTPTTDNSATAMDPDISGNIAVWRNWMTGKIVVHHLDTGVEESTSAIASQEVSPAISGNKVVWIDSRASTQYYDLYLRDITEPAEVPVTLASDLPAGSPDYKKDKRNPDIDGNIVVWEDWRNAFQDASGWVHNPDIYMKDLTTGVVAPVCTDLSDQYNPTVSGNRILWQDYRNGNWDVYMKDISTGIETRLSPSNEHQTWPSISGDLVAWKNQTIPANYVEDIVTMNLATGVQNAVTADTPAQKMPVVSGQTVAWMDKRNGNPANWDIYSAGDVIPPVISSPAPSGWNNGATVLSANYSDGGTGIDAASAVVTLDGSPVAGCTATAGSVSCPVSSLAGGAHTAVFNVRDLANNSSAPVSTTFNVDVAGPDTTGASPSGWLLDNNSVVVTASYVDAGVGVDPASVAVAIDGTPVAGCSAGAAAVSCPAVTLADGPHGATINLRDLLGNPSVEWVAEFGVDTTGPVLGPLSIDVPIGSDTAAISSPVHDAGIGVEPTSVHVYVDGAEPAGCTLTTDPVTCTATGLAIGSHTVLVDATDRLGHISNISSEFNVADTATPVISNTLPAGSLATAAVAISADYTDPPAPITGINAASVAVTMNGSPVPGCTVTAASISCPVRDLPNGTYLVTLQVSDNAGNTASAEWSFTIAAAGPIIANMQPAPGAVVNYGWPSISADFADNGRGVDGATARISLDGTELAADATGSYIYLSLDPTSTPRLANGVHTVDVTVADNQGELSTQTWTFTVTSPTLRLYALRTYWPSYAAYLQRLLSIDYYLANPGLGACKNGEVTTGTATAGVLVIGPVPVSMGDLTGGNTFNFTLQYLVPPGVAQFVATTYVNCQDDGGSSYFFPGPAPQQ